MSPGTLVHQTQPDWYRPLEPEQGRGELMKKKPFHDVTTKTSKLAFFSSDHDIDR
uniref:Uncharacterized protein n=1 Tax=Rhizophora mucronata TaxID=61149 RepID=A0A2P2PG61_RHIMU